MSCLEPPIISREIENRWIDAVIYGRVCKHTWKYSMWGQNELQESWRTAAQENQAPQQQNIKKLVVAQDLCTLLYTVHKSFSTINMDKRS